MYNMYMFPYKCMRDKQFQVEVVRNMKWLHDTASGSETENKRQ